MKPKPKRNSLPKPSVFKLGNRWVCEYYRFDDTGRPKAHRKAFVRELTRGGVKPSVSKQRTAALTYRDEILKERQEEEKLERREKEQSYLTLKELKEAKAAFAIFNQIPYRQKSLVDAVVLYRDGLKLAGDTPPLKTCVAVFLGRKQDAAEGKHGQQTLSYDTYRTLKQRLNHMVEHFVTTKGMPNIKVGEVSSRLLIEYFDSIASSDRTRSNYIADVANFFNDSSDSRDKHRFIDKNPMDGVYVHYKKTNRSRGRKNGRYKAKAPVILQIERSKHALQIAYDMREQGMLGFTVAGLFLGMRPSEVYDMVAIEDFWRKYIKLEEGVVRVDGFGKKRDQRTILIGDNCKAWLEFIDKHNLPFCFPKKKNGQNLQYANFRAKAFLPEAAMAAKLIKLRRLYKTGKKPNAEEKAFMQQCNVILQEHEDVLRHTHGTNFYYNHGSDKNLTIEQLGHSAEVFVSNYRGLLNSPKDAKKFDQLMPQDFVA